MATGAKGGQTSPKIHASNSITKIPTAEKGQTSADIMAPYASVGNIAAEEAPYLNNLAHLYNFLRSLKGFQKVYWDPFHIMNTVTAAQKSAGVGVVDLLKRSMMKTERGDLEAQLNLNEEDGKVGGLVGNAEGAKMDVGGHFGGGGDGGGGGKFVYGRERFLSRSLVVVFKSAKEAKLGIESVNRFHRPQFNDLGYCTNAGMVAWLGSDSTVFGERGEIWRTVMEVLDAPKQELEGGKVNVAVPGTTEEVTDSLKVDIRMGYLFDRKSVVDTFFEGTVPRYCNTVVNDTLICQVY
jgi:hypothetical protein